MLPVDAAVCRCKPAVSSFCEKVCGPPSAGSDARSVWNDAATARHSDTAGRRHFRLVPRPSAWTGVVRVCRMSARHLQLHCNAAALETGWRQEQTVVIAAELLNNNNNTAVIHYFCCCSNQLTCSCVAC